MRIRDNVNISRNIRATSLGELNNDPTGISISILNALPTSISTTYIASDIQKIDDAVKELRKLLG